MTSPAGVRRVGSSETLLPPMLASPQRHSGSSSSLLPPASTMEAPPSPALTVAGCSSDAGGANEMLLNLAGVSTPQEAARSMPDLELHCRRTSEASALGPLPAPNSDAAPSCRLRSSFLVPHHYGGRCRCEMLPLARSASRESVRSAHHQASRVWF